MRFILFIFFFISQAYADTPRIIVYPKDTIDSLAKRHNVPKAFLVKANDLKPPYKLKQGCALRYPPMHRVQKGEDFESIRQKYKLSEEMLAGHNGLKKPYKLKQGQVLYLSKLELPAKKNLIKPSVSKPIKPVLKKENADFCWPVAQKRNNKVLSRFGPSKDGKKNDGINIACAEGAEVYAMKDGVVAFAGDKLKNYGNLILIKHSNQFHTTYAHLSKILVKEKQNVKKGQKIGLVGASGSVEKPQLHFEIRKNLKPQNPETYLNSK